VYFFTSHYSRLITSRVAAYSRTFQPHRFILISRVNVIAKVQSRRFSTLCNPTSLGLNFVVDFAFDISTIIWLLCCKLLIDLQVFKTVLLVKPEANN
jgi:hypothetical protein